MTSTWGIQVRNI